LEQKHNNEETTVNEQDNRLTAAAPELLAALQVIVRALERGSYFDPANAIKLAQEAIAKATATATPAK
jgi:hypothetical protein